MNQQTTHLITLWCAVLSKAGKGFSRAAPKGMPLLSARCLLQLSLPESSLANASQLAHALVAKPSDVVSALETLARQGYIAPNGEQLLSDGSLSPLRPLALAEKGRACSKSIQDNFHDFNIACWSELDSASFELLMEMVYDAVVRPGSFIAYRALSIVRSARIPDAYYATCICMLGAMADTVSKGSASLSLTDYRFLLELAPKRRGVTKRLRAKEMVNNLAVGRSYVSTASTRLEGLGLIERVPSETDMRGVDFELSAAGKLLVQEVGDDLAVAFDGLFRPRIEQHTDMIRMMKYLLIGTDKALGAWEASYE